MPAATGPPSEPPGRPLRVFVHHRANASPAMAEEVAQSLRGAGIEVTALRPSAFVPSTPVVRYFHEEDQATAARLAGRLGRSWAIQDFRAYAPQPPPGTLEVWLPGP
jgi:NAD(P)-dependent dehydrogenase (short-subunit alcohol dehydrogenase family)